MTDQVGSSGDHESEVERTLGTLATLNPAYALDHEAPATAPAVTIDELYRTHRMQMVRQPSRSRRRILQPTAEQATVQPP